MCNRLFQLSASIKASVPLVAILFALLLSASAFAYENTVHIRVSPDRLWQCGENFYATGGSETYRFAKIYADERLIDTLDFAKAEDCQRQIEYVADLPDGGKSIVTVEVGG